jgi:hypothetical protein
VKGPTRNTYEVADERAVKLEQAEELLLQSRR